MTQWGLDTLFNPAKRHMDEEKRRLQSTREEVGDNSGGKRIDLESGKVVISRAGEDEDTPGASEQADGASTSKSAAKPGTKDAAKDGKPSPAAERAAKRRARNSAT